MRQRLGPEASRCHRFAEVDPKGFNSRRLHHSTHLALAFGEPQGSLMASHCQGECPERAQRVEGPDFPNTPSDLTFFPHTLKSIRAPRVHRAMCGWDALYRL